MSDRLTHLTELIRKHQAARDMTASLVWGELWNTLEQELLERLLQCDATDDVRRYRLQVSIEIGRTFRRMMESRSVTPADLEKEIGFLDGTRVRPIA